MADALYLYCHSDHSFVLDFFQRDFLVENIVISAHEGEVRLIQCLQKHARAKMMLKVFLDETMFVRAEASIPQHFDDNDILEYLLIEQAKLFPMLDEKIYIDFFKVSCEEGVQKIAVVACNAKSWLFLEEICNALRLDWRYLGAQHQQNIYNLLPWRNLAEKAQKRRFCYIVVVFTLGLVFMLSLFGLLLFSQLLEDEKQEHVYYVAAQKILPQLNELEKINREYEYVLKQSTYQEKTMQQQLRLVQLLMLIESRRSKEIQLTKITSEKQVFNLTGKAKDAQHIDHYINYLNQNRRVQLVSMEPSEDKDFPVKFEIEEVGA